MTCGNCGSELTDTARFCFKCGAPQARTESPAVAPVNPVDGAAPAQSTLPDDDPRIGLTIAEKYRLDARLGIGGMATVYRATRLLIGDTVAVKVLHAEQMRDAEARERFRREAQAAARIKHPNAVTIYDFGVTGDGLTYLVMELVEGVSLRSLLKEQGPLAPGAAVEIIAQACSALEEAHAQNVVHRDLKPDNIVVRTSATGFHVKVLDFGIARLRDLGDRGNLTQTGSVMGTPHYMSPEQCLGEELDGRSDIYSLGVILYEMLAGIVPFNSPTSMAVVVQHVNTTPASLRTLNVSIPEAIEAVVMRTLEKRRETRPQSARALADALRAAVTGVLPVSIASGHSTPALSPTVQMQTPFSGGMPSPYTPLSSPVPAVGAAPAARGNVWAIAGGACLIVALLGSAGYWMLGSTDTPRDEPDQVPMSSTGSYSEATVPAAPNGTGEPSPTDPANAQQAPFMASPGSSTGVTGGLRIRTEPGTRIQIDGMEMGTAPANGLMTLSGVPAGRRTMIASRSGYQTDRRTVIVAPGRQEDLALRLTPLPGSLVVTANVAGAAFQIANGRRYDEQIPGAELPPGTYRITASKSGYKSASSDAVVRPGETTRLTMTLAELTTSDLLAEARTAFRSGQFERAATTAGTVMSKSPNNAAAALLAGDASLRLKRFDDSVTYYTRAVDLGAEVRIPASHRHAGALIREGFCPGAVVVSRETVAYRGSDAKDHDFTARSKGLLEVKRSAFRVDTRVVITEDGKEERKNYDFVHPRARRAAVGSGIVTELRCPVDCDDSMDVLYSLLNHVAGR